MGIHDARQPDPSAKRVRDVVITTRSLTADADDLDIGQADILVIDVAGAFAITGIANPYNGRRVDIVNTDEANTVTLQNQNNNSAPENQFRMAMDLDLTTEEAVTVIYIAQRWRPIAAG